MATPNQSPPNDASPPPPRIEQVSDIKTHLPLHYFVWHKNVDALKAELAADRFDIETKDVRGRTPLMLATVLGHREVMLPLLGEGANVMTQDNDGFDALDEALFNPGDVSSKSTTDFQLLREFHENRDVELDATHELCLTTIIAPALANLQTSHFYFEVKCQPYSSYIPFIKPSSYADTLKVYIAGNRIRIDTTLLKIKSDNIVPKVERCNMSYVFTFTESEATFLIVNHETQSYSRNGITLDGTHEWMKTSDRQIRHNLKSIAIHNFDFNQLSIVPVQSWFKKTHKTIDRHKCALYELKGIALHRRDHVSTTSKGPNCVTLPTDLEYFSGAKDVIRAKRKFVHSKKEMSIQMWISTDPAIPLTIEQHVVPILALVSLCWYAYDAKGGTALQNVLTSVPFPSGFPLQLEIPTCTHTWLGLKMELTFGNIQARDKSVEGIGVLEGGACQIEDSIFAVAPQHYTSTD